MRLPDREVVKAWIGARVQDEVGEEIGTCSTVFADDDTGASEWLSVALSGGGTSMVPIVGAREEDGSVRIAFPRSLVESAPEATGAHLSVEEEKTLYDHYGVPYSTSESSTVLPAADVAAAGTPLGIGSPTTAGPSPTAAGHRAPSGQRTASLAQSPRVAGPLVALALAVAAAVLRRRGARLRRRPPTRLEVVRATGRDAARRGAPALAATAERLRAGTGPAVRHAGDGLLRGSLYTAAMGSVLGQRAAPPVRRAGEEGLKAGRSAARAAGTVGRSGAKAAGSVALGMGLVAGEGALRGGRVAGASALRGGRVAAGRATSAGSKARAVPRAARAAGARSVAPVGRTYARARKAGRKAVNRSLIAVGLSAGYVLGARSGRERYDEIVAKAREAAQGLRGESPSPAPQPATPTPDSAVASTAPAGTSTPRPGTPQTGPQEPVVELVDLTQTEPDAVHDRP